MKVLSELILCELKINKVDWASITTQMEALNLLAISTLVTTSLL